MNFLPCLGSAGRRQLASGWTHSSLRCALLNVPYMVSTRLAAYHNCSNASAWILGQAPTMPGALQISTGARLHPVTADFGGA